MMAHVRAHNFNFGLQSDQNTFESTSELINPRIHVMQGEGTAQLGMGGASTWEVLDESGEETQKSSTMAARVKQVKGTVKEIGEKSKVSKEKVSEVNLDSEEEDIIVLTKEEVSGGSSKGVSTVTTSLSELIMLESSTKESRKSNSKENSEVEQSPPEQQPTGSAAVGSSGQGRRDMKDISSHADQVGASDVQETKGRTRGKRKKRKGSKT